MRETTVCYLIRDEEVLLGFKKRGFGQGKYTGIGGKIEAGENPAQAVIRELQEEIGVLVSEGDLIHCGIIRFRFPAKPDWDLGMVVFTAEQWSGKPIEGDEVKPLWFGFDELPIDQMWNDAKLWMPHVLNGGTIDATVFYHDDNETADDIDVLF